MSKYSEIAKQVVEHIGGVKNINSVTNCMTRLRFSLKDTHVASVDKLEKIKGVQGVVNKNGQFQVIIGTDVALVCEEIKRMGNFSETISQAGEEKVSVVNKVLGTITAIFQPVIPAICGAGMIKAVLALLTACHLLEASSQTYTLLSMFADAAFYFLPIILAFSSAKRFNCNPYVAAVLGGILIHPTFSGLVSAGDAVNFIGLPVKLISYGSAVVPPILIVLLQSYVEKFAKKISPNAIKVFLVPLIVFLIVAPLALIIIGPLGSIIGDGLYVVFDFLNNEARWVIPVLMGAFCPLLVMTGMHYSLMPVQLAQYATLGYGTLLGPGMLASNLAQAGACFAVALRTKDKELKGTAVSAGTTALFGITEPALYGITMRLKKPLLAVMIGGGVAGLWGGLTNMRTYASATAGILALPVYITDDLSNVVNAVICMIIAVVVTFFVTLFLGIKDEGEGTVEKTAPVEALKKEASPLNKVKVVASPMTGEVVKLEQVNDEVFSKGIMGKGVAIRPSEGKVVSPVDGTVNAVFPTKHAIGLTSEDGIEILIHIGLDTVELEGKPFEAFVKNGDKVKKNDLLVTFDMEAIKKAGYDTVTPIIITNSADYVEIMETDALNIKRQDELVKVFS